MRKTIAVVLLLTALAIASFNRVRGDGETGDGKASVRPPVALTEDEIRELQQIRQRLGLSPLQGPLWSRATTAGDGSLTREFADQLRRGFGEQPAEMPAERLSSPSGDGELNGSGSDTAAAVGYRQRSLRSLCRHLEALAADMDVLELHDEAQQLRRMSHQLSGE
jgi:hypothetical protein